MSRKRKVADWDDRKRIGRSSAEYRISSPYNTRTKLTFSRFLLPILLACVFYFSWLWVNVGGCGGVFNHL